MGLLDLRIPPNISEPVPLPFGEWLPDQMAANNPGALEVLNALPLVDGTYGPMFSPVADVNSAVIEAVKGAASVLQASNITQIYAGGANGIYTRLGGGAFQTLLTSVVNANYPWQFIRYKTLMLAMHRDLFPMKMTIGATAAPVVLGGNPPRAACGAVVGDFFVVGNLLQDQADGNSAVPNRIRWNGIKNLELPWVTDPATQADYNEMPAEGGAVIAIAGRTDMTIFQERKISIGRYVNLPAVWDIQVREQDVGCIARDSVVEVGAYKFFIAQDGFRIWNGISSQRIGDGKVDKYFFSRLAYRERHRIVGAFDPITNCVYWAFPIASDGLLGELIIYSPSTNRFTHSIQTLEWLLETATSNLTTDDLTGLIDADPRLVDDPTFTAGGRSLLGMFSQGHLYSTFSGPSLPATFDTGEFSGPSNTRVFVNLARPLIDNTLPNVSITPLGRDELMGDPLLLGSAVNQEIDGNCPILAEAKYLRFRAQTVAGSRWQHAEGIQIWRMAGGRF